MISLNIRQYWRHVFSVVLDEYKELQSVQGTPSAEQFYKALAKEGVKGSRNPKEVLPNVLDFMADVVLAAKSALSVQEYAQFKRAYLDTDIPGANLGLRSLQEKVGMAFLSRRIYPSSLYFSSGVGQESKACVCGDKEHKAAATSTVWCVGGCGKNTLHHPVGMFDKHPIHGHTICWCQVCSARDEERLIEEVNERRNKEAA
jgi:hypothetical protein